MTRLRSEAPEELYGLQNAAVPFAILRGWLPSGRIATMFTEPSDATTGSEGFAFVVKLIRRSRSTRTNGQTGWAGLRFADLIGTRR